MLDQVDLLDRLPLLGARSPPSPSSPRHSSASHLLSPSVLGPLAISLLRHASPPLLERDASQQGSLSPSSQDAAPSFPQLRTPTRFRMTPSGLCSSTPGSAQLSTASLWDAVGTPDASRPGLASPGVDSRAISSLWDLPEAEAWTPELASGLRRTPLSCSVSELPRLTPSRLSSSQSAQSLFPLPDALMLPVSEMQSASVPPRALPKQQPLAKRESHDAVAAWLQRAHNGDAAVLLAMPRISAGSAARSPSPSPPLTLPLRFAHLTVQVPGSGTPAEILWTAAQPASRPTAEVSDVHGCNALPETTDSFGSVMLVQQDRSAPRSLLVVCARSGRVLSTQRVQAATIRD